MMKSPECIQRAMFLCHGAHGFILNGDAENAGLGNAGPDLHGWKTRDNRLWNAKCLLMHEMQFQITSQNTYCTLQSINQSNATELLLRLNARIDKNYL